MPWKQVKASRPYFPSLTELKIISAFILLYALVIITFVFWNG